MPSLRSIGFACITLLPLSGSAANATKAQDQFAICFSNAEDSVVFPACIAVANDKTRGTHDRAVAYATAGYAKLGTSGNEESLAYFEKSLALDKNSDWAYAGRGTIEFASKNYDAAIADCSKAVKLDPDAHPDSYLLLGTLADRNGDHDARIAYINKAIALAPNYAEAYAGRGHGYMDLKRYDQALADFNKAISLKPELAPMLKMNFLIVYIERASGSIKSGKFQDGIEDLKKALKFEPQDARALNDLGDAYNMTYEYDKAAKVLTQDIELNPGYSSAYTNRGITYIHIGKYELGLADLSRAIELGDHKYSTYFIRGEAYLSLHDRKSALADFRKALELAPPDASLLSNIQVAIRNADK